MAWVKLDDQFPDHPKVAKAGPLASWLYVCGLAYCNRYLTDGFIPQAQVRRLADVECAAELASRLIDTGLWEEAEGGYQIHDYLEYQPARDRAEATKHARAEAGSKGGKQRASNLLERSLKEDASKTQAKVNPVPDPVPDVLPAPNGAGQAPPDETPTAAPDGAPPTLLPFVLVEALIDEMRSVGKVGDDWRPPGRWKDKQSGVAVQLITDGHTEADVRACIRYLRTGAFTTIDLPLVKSQIDTWKMSGQPEFHRKVPAAGSNGASNGRHNPDGNVIRAGQPIDHGKYAAALAANAVPATRT